MAKYRMTPFARFFIFLIIITPLVYLGAAYYNGVDGIAQIKSFLGMDKSDSNSPSEQKVKKMSTSEWQALLKEKQDSIKLLKDKLQKDKEKWGQ